MAYTSVRSFGFVAATVFAALQGMPCGSGRAYAGCGDYVQLGRGDAESGLTLEGTPPRAGQELHRHGPPPAPPPCRGSHCRQGPLSPLAPVPLPPSHGADQKACLAAAAEMPAVAKACLVPEPVALADDCPGRQIERPPKLHS